MARTTEAGGWHNVTPDDFHNVVVPTDHRTQQHSPDQQPGNLVTFKLETHNTTPFTSTVTSQNNIPDRNLTPTVAEYPTQDFVFGSPMLNSSPSISGSLTQEEEMAVPTQSSLVNVPPHDDPDWFTNQLLQRYGLIIHIGLRVVICIQCRFAVQLTKVESHLNKHRIPALPAQLDELSVLFGSHGLTDSNDRDVRKFPLRSHPAVDILPIIPNGHRCRECTFAAPAYNTIRMHVGQLHPHLTGRPHEDQWSIGPIQALFQKSCYFGVNTFITRESTDAFRLYMEEVDAMGDPEPELPENPREYPPLLADTGWPQQMKDFFGDDSKQHRYALISILHPKGNDHDPFKHAVIKYMKEIRDLSGDSSLSIRKTLMYGPGDTSDTRPWSAFSNDNTVESYSVPATSLLFAIATTLVKPNAVRYKFPLGAKAKSAFDRLVTSWKAGQGIPVENIHLALASLLLVENRDKPEYNNKWDDPIECWLAAYALRADGSFMGASDFTQLLAKLQYHVRGAVLYQAKVDTKGGDRLLSEVVKSLGTSNLAPSAMESSFNSFLDYSRFASSIVYGEAKVGDTVISPDRLMFTHQGTTIHIPAIRDGLRAALNDLENLMASIRKNVPIPVNVPDDAVDDISNTTYGYSFLSGASFGNPHALMDILLRDKSLYTQTGAELEWSLPAVQQLLEQFANVNRLFQLLLHIVPGQPTRGTEATDFRIRNGLRRRNIYRAAGATWLINVRTKTEHISGKESFIPRKLPSRLAKLFHLYLFVYVPTAAFLSSKLWKENGPRNYLQYLWVRNGKVVKATEFSETLGELTERYFGVRVTVGPWRQFSAAITRAWLGHEGDGDIEDEVDVYAEQRGHSLTMSRSHYGVETHSVNGLLIDDWRRYGEASSRWQSIFGFNPLFDFLLPVEDRNSLKSIGQAMAGRTGTSFDYRELEKVLTNAMRTVVQESQARDDNRIKAAVAEGIAQYDRKKNSSRLNLSFDNPPASNKAVFGVSGTSPANRIGSASKTSHIATEGERFESHSVPFAVYETTGDTAPGRAQLQVTRDTAMSGSVKPDFDLMGTGGSTSLPTTEFTGMTRVSGQDAVGMQDVPQEGGDGVDPLTAEQLLDVYLRTDGSNFRNPMQKRIVEEAMKGEESFLAVMPTASGKSLAYFLPSMMGDRKYTIVVLPYRALMADIRRRATCHRVHVWTTDKDDPGDAELVLISLESYTSAKFKQFFNRNRNRIARIVFDEAHLIIIDDSFRDHYTHVVEAAKWIVQKIYLSGSLPPADFAAFCFANGVDKGLTEFRCSTDRANVGYHVVSVPGYRGRLPDLIGTAALLVENLSHSLTTEERGIVFARSRVEVEALSESLGVAKYHSNMSDSDRSNSQLAWIGGGNNSWIIATSGFLHGIDFPRVRHVIFIGLPYRFTDLVQGAGRLARRDGVGDVIVLHDGSTNIGKTSKFTHHVKELVELANSHGCRRSIMTRLMDGESVVCQPTLGDRRCDNCDPNSEMAVMLRALFDITTPSVNNADVPHQSDPTCDYDQGVLQPSDVALVPSKRPASHPLPGPPNRRPFDSATPSSSRCCGEARTQLKADGSSRWLAKTPSHTSTAGQSMSLHLDSALYKSQGAESDSKKNHLSDILEGIKGCCPVCFIWHKKKVERECSHKAFVSCDPIRGGADYGLANGWINLKRGMNLPSGHCFSCGFALRKYRPSSHPDSTAPDDCPYPNCVPHVLWYARKTPEIWTRIEQTWCPPYFENDMAVGKWLATHDPKDTFYRGIEIFIWIWDTFVYNTE